MCRVLYNVKYVPWLNMFTGSEHALTTTSCFDIDITLIDSMQNLEQLVFHFKSKSCESLFYSRGKKLTPLFALFSVAYRVFLTDSQFNSCLRIPTYCACPLPGVRCHSFSVQLLLRSLSIDVTFQRLRLSTSAVPEPSPNTHFVPRT